tara:strand:+ start:76 stop:699 length:624 start_codon:yes stop_codon:yes gene_type:complete
MTKLDPKYNDYRYLKAIENYKIQNAIKSKAKKFLDENMDTLEIILDLIHEQNFNSDTFCYTIEYKVNSFYYNIAKDLHNNLFTYGKLTEKQLAFISTFKTKMKTNIDNYYTNLNSKLQSNYFGNVNEKYDLELTIKSVKEIETQFGYTFKHELIDTNKNLFVYFSASKNLLELNDNNNSIKINAKIKSHNEYNNIKSTVIKLPKILK